MNRSRKILKRALSLLLAVLTAASLAAPALAANARTIHIGSAAELLELSRKCRLDTFSQNLTVILDCDIDLTGTDFEPIPTFGGVFEGGSHTVSGMKLTADGSHQGFFRYIQPEGVVRNLQLSAEIEAGAISTSVGGFVGSNFGTLQECSFYGSVEGESHVGGFAGENNGKIVTCTNYASVVGRLYSGGIAGYNSGEIEACTNFGKVNTVIIEEVGVDLDTLTVEDITSLPFITSKADDVVSDVGGIAGLSDGVVRNCENAGEVGYERFGYNIGGIVGRQAGFVSSCKNSAPVLGYKDVGGIIGQMEPFMLLKTTENMIDELQSLADSLDAAAANLSSNAGEAGHVLDQMRATANEATDNALDLNENSRNKLEIESNIPIVSELAEEYSDRYGFDSLIKEEGETNPAWENIKGIFGDFGSSVIDFSSTVGEGTMQDIIDGNMSKNQQTQITEAGTQSAVDFGENLRERIETRREEEAERQERYDTATSNLVDNIGTLARSFSSLSKVLSTATGEFADDIMEVNYHFYRATNLLAILLRGEKVHYDDISEEDTEGDTDGKAVNCSNSGAVEGETCVGGIIGDMALEQEFDLEGIVTSILDANDFIFNTYETRCVARGCVNDAPVSAKSHNVGGIVGYEELGLIYGCENYGSVSSDDGNYVGGVAGRSSTVIHTSYALCEISGANFVGGIAGSGERIYDCAARVSVTEYSACVGAIAGTIDDESGDTELIGNIFISETLGGIDGISYGGKAEPVSEAAFMNLSYLPDRFRQITVTFTSDGNVIGAVGCVYGRGIVSGSLPPVPEKKGFTGHWPELDYASIAANMTVQAIYNPEQASLASEQYRENSPMSILLLEGSFDDSAALTFEPFEGPLPVIEGGTAREAWTFRVTNHQPDGSIYAVHFQPPEKLEAHDRFLIYARSGDSWQLIKTRTSGSYLVFDAIGVGVTFCAVEYPGSFDLHLPILFGALAVLLVVIVLLLLRRRRKKKLDPDTESLRSIVKAVREIEKENRAGEPLPAPAEFTSRRSAVSDQTASRPRVADATTRRPPVPEAPTAGTPTAEKPTADPKK